MIRPDGSGAPGSAAHNGEKDKSMDFITITIDRKVLKEIESIVEEFSWGAPTGPGPGEEPPEYTRAGVRSVLDALRRAMKEANANAAHAAMVRKEARFDFGDAQLLEQKEADLPAR